MDGGMNPTLATRCQRRLRQTYWRTFPPGPFLVDDAPPTALAALRAVELAAQIDQAKGDEPKAVGPRAGQPIADASVAFGPSLDGLNLDGLELELAGDELKDHELKGHGRQLDGSAMAAPKADDARAVGPNTQTTADGDGLLSPGEPLAGEAGLELALTSSWAALPPGSSVLPSPIGGLDAPSLAGAVLTRESPEPPMAIAAEPVSSVFAGSFELPGGLSWNKGEEQAPTPCPVMADPELPLSPSPLILGIGTEDRPMDGAAEEAALAEPDLAPGSAQPNSPPDWLGTLLWMALTGLDGWLAFTELLKPLGPVLVRQERVPIRPFAGAGFQPLGRLRLRQPLGS